MILQGQVWRIITFVMVPPSTNLILCVILLYVYYMLGRQMEGILGTFRFNVFIFRGLFFMFWEVSWYMWQPAAPIGSDRIHST